MTRFLFIGSQYFLFFTLLCSPSRAQSKLAEEILNTSNLRAFAPGTLSLKNYHFEWIGKKPDGIELSVDEESIEWIRIREILALPRARAVMNVRGNSTGQIEGPGFVVPLSPHATTHFPLPLIASEDIQYKLVLTQNNQSFEYLFRLIYNEIDKSELIYLDPSCSRYDLKAILKSEKKQGWMSVGCHLDPMLGKNHQTASLELLIFWQRPHSQVEINSAPIEKKLVSELISVRASPQLDGPLTREPLRLKSDQTEVILHYRLAPRIFRGNVGIGVGPYLYEFSKNEEMKKKPVVMPTLYVSYMTSSTSRLVAFEATPLAYPWTTDLGVYLAYESGKFFDRRVSFQVLLGGHLIGFESHDGYKFLAGAPQGVEFIGTDIFKPGYNMAGGAFIFPWIGGKAYNNVWLRWGNKKIFGEFNYIMWKEKVDNVSYSSRSYGITIGMPLSFLSFL